MINPLWGDRLVDSDHKGNYRPWLATDIKFSDDYLTCTIKLRQDVKFHDGEPFTSEDVKATFGRLKTEKNLAQAFKWGNYLTDNPVETPDAYTAILHFSQPMPTFYTELAMIPMIENKTYNADPQSYFNRPIGTGPFKVITFDPTTNIVSFQRNDEWWAWTADNKSNVDIITYKSIPEDTTRVSSLRSGEVDVIKKVPLDTVSFLEKEGIKVDGYSSDEIMMMGLSCQPDKPFADKNLREALSLCINRQLIVDSILGGGSVVKWPVVEGNPANKPDAKGYEYNLDRAKQLVASSSYKGQPLSVIVSSAAQLRNSEVAQAIQSMAAEAGINLTITLLEDVAYMDKRDAGNYDINLTSVIQTDGEYYIDLVEFNGRDRFKTGFKNSRLTEIAAISAKTVDPQERAALAKEGFQIIIDNFAPFIYLYWIPGSVAMAGDVSNIGVYHDLVVDLRYTKKD